MNVSNIQTTVKEKIMAASRQFVSNRQRLFGAFGGVCFIVGWLLLALSALGK